MKKFGIVIATVIVMALTGCSSKEKTTTADKVEVEVSTEDTTEVAEVTTEVTTEEVTTEEIVEIEGEKSEKSEKTTESVAQTTGVQQTTEAPKPATTEAPKPTQSTQQTSSPAPKSTTTEAPKPTTTEAPAPAPVQQTPVTTEAPAPVHQHTWDTRTETVTEAWTETVEHPAVTHKELRKQCSYCGGFYSDMNAHSESYQGIDTKHAIAGWHTANQTIVDQEAWTEIVEHSAVTKDVTYCTECGATK